MNTHPTRPIARLGEERPYRKGYRLAPDLRAEIAAAHRTRPLLTMSCAALDVVVAVSVSVACGWLLAAVSVWVALPLVVLGCLVVARQLRALENLTHEASHYNWARHQRRWNDALGWLLAGLPTGGRLSDYRESHLRHHGRFGTSQDPDRRRYAELDLEGMRRSSAGAFAASVLGRAVRYQIGWLREVRSDLSVTTAALLWSVVVVAVPTGLFAGPFAAVLAEGFWIVSAFVVLPVLRLVAEADEHIYSDCDTVFEATISNIGLVQRLLVHPHADGYHTVHHLWPGIPHHALRRTHLVLMSRDPEYARRIRIRRGVLDTPRAAGATPTR
ncbi:fatty acid desaturase family protein [Streptomyces sp. NPDC006879]|uniref:fatty acid desaturase family protein n=1 Tax=Streptomyces sp. NPDC006879 TaxID=3364767 RepID=UPI00369BFB18